MGRDDRYGIEKTGQVRSWQFKKSFLFRLSKRSLRFNAFAKEFQRVFYELIRNRYVPVLMNQFDGQLVLLKVGNTCWAHIHMRLKAGQCFLGKRPLHIVCEKAVDLGTRRYLALQTE